MSPLSVTDLFTIGIGPSSSHTVGPMRAAFAFVTMGAIKAINAAYLALHGDGRHIVSLDQVIETMRQTGEDMKSQYKETSQGGLAVNVVEC